MNKIKKTPLLICIFLTALSIAACGKTKEAASTADQQESNMQTVKDANSENNVQTAENEDSENNVQTAKDTAPESTADELLDQFINGSINAVHSTDEASTFNITDLNMDSEEWDSFSIGEKADLDNDGENELILCGPYGGIYLDARDNKVYAFAAGKGTALTLSYTCYNGDTWILYSNRMNTGYKAYHMEKFEGADNLTAEINFGEELIDQNNAESGMKYNWNGTEISQDEYETLCSKILAAEVRTD